MSTNAAVDRASSSQRSESGCMRDGSTGPGALSPHLASAGVVLRRTAQRRARALAGVRARERACQSWGRCHLGRPVACDSTMPPMTGPSITSARSSYSPRPASSSGSGSNPGSPGQPISRCAPRTRKNGGGCPATPASRTGTSPKPRFMPRSPWPPPPRSPAWARTAGRGPMSPEPSSAADNSRRRDRHPQAGLLAGRDPVKQQIPLSGLAVQEGVPYRAGPPLPLGGEPSGRHQLDTG